MKFLGFDKYFSFDNRLDEIEAIKQHVEVVYQYVKDHVEQEQSKYQIPDIDSDYVTCTLTLSPYDPQGQDGPFKIKLFFPLLGDEEEKLNFRTFFNGQHFFENELTNMFKEFDISIFYPSKEHYQDIRHWRQL